MNNIEGDQKQDKKAMSDEIDDGFEDLEIASDFLLI